MLFGYSPLVRMKCIHKPQFTNAVFANELQKFQLVFLKTIQEYYLKPWSKIKKARNCHYVKKDDCRRLGKYLGLTKKELDNFINNEAVYQIAMVDQDKERRIFGSLRDLSQEKIFEILLLDPNHLFYYNLRKSQYPWGSEAVCLMSKENCSRVFECQPDLPRSSRKEETK